MIEKPSKDGKTQTIEYQEEEILVSIKMFNYLQWIFMVNTLLHKYTYNKYTYHNNKDFL